MIIILTIIIKCYQRRKSCPCHRSLKIQSIYSEFRSKILDNVYDCGQVENWARGGEGQHVERNLVALFICLFVLLFLAFFASLSHHLRTLERVNRKKFDRPLTDPQLGNDPDERDVDELDERDRLLGGEGGATGGFINIGTTTSCVSSDGGVSAAGLSSAS